MIIMPLQKRTSMMDNYSKRSDEHKKSLAWLPPLIPFTARRRIHCAAAW